MIYTITEAQRQQLLDALKEPSPTFGKTIAAIDLLQSLAPVDAGPVLGTKTWIEGGVVMTQNLTASDIYPAPLRELSDAEIRDLWVTEIETYEDALAFARAVLRKAGEK